MAKSPRHAHCHDYGLLCRRWRKLAAGSRLVMRKFGEAGGYPLYFLRPRKIEPSAPAVYLSAGIHGDEAASSEALLTWAEKNVPLLSTLNLLIFPCLNPWGLVHNRRSDQDGRDLNRSFNNDTVPQVVAQIALFAKHQFDLAIMLHEDYDATGVYLYEVRTQQPFWGEKLLRSARRFIGPDTRKSIEGRPARGGVVRRPVSQDLMDQWPEAFPLFFQKTPRVFTVEAPSEFFIDDRVNALVAVVEKAVALCRREFALRKKPPRAS